MAEPSPHRVGGPVGGLAALGVAEAAALVAARQVSSEALVQACLDRIEERDGLVRAWVHAPADRALAQARERDATDPVGPLHGVPVGIKDLVDTRDLPTAYGSPIFSGHRPAEDARVVQALVAAGAVVLGKTVTTEFALFHPGPTANPHDLGHTPGGSSSGSAAAVADHHVPLAVGTQTAGSVVRPASFCGVWGGKPTFDAIPTAGTRPAAASLDTLGLFTRSADDLIVALAAVAGATGPPRTASIGFARTPEWDAADPSTQEALVRLASELDLPEVILPEAFDALVAAQSTVMDVEVATALRDVASDHRDELSTELQDLLDRARTVTSAQERAAREVVARCRADLDGALGDHDALLVPAVLGVAF